MGFEKGRPLKNVLYGVTHPLETARHRPILFMLLVGTGVFFLGVWQGWWSFESVKGFFESVLRLDGK